jgi:hypothetical protein
MVFADGPMILPTLLLVTRIAVEVLLASTTTELRGCVAVRE